MNAEKLHHHDEPGLKPGLVSVTFRQLSPQQILDLAVEAKLETIEWGGDIHVPHGDTQKAEEVRCLTHQAGLSVAAYGSYYRAGEDEAGGLVFADVLETAVALGAPTIRVWAGKKGAMRTSATKRRKIIADVIRVADLAQKRGVTISLEYHEDTLTDTRESVRLLMAEAPHPNLKFLWQPSNGETERECRTRLLDVGPRLGNIHVFHWGATDGDRRPLEEGESRWSRYLGVIRNLKKPRACLLEFVRENEPKQFLEDAATLRRWLAPRETLQLRLERQV